LDELPFKLKEELQARMHQNMYSNVTFFKERDETFLAWISTVVKDISFQEKEFIYKEGEKANESKS
jgi:hypothetical protein